jgi:hypothetical protein
MIERSQFCTENSNTAGFMPQENPYFTLRFGLLLIAAQLTGESAHAQQIQSIDVLAPVRVEERPYGEELVGPYNQPRWSARGRFSANTDVYVLPPYSFYLDVDYHGTFPRRGVPDHLFIQEFELGLPHRFQLAFELYEEAQDGRVRSRSR